MLDRTLSIAPMMAWTDRHYRYLMRLLLKHTLLYTEMVTTPAILHGDQDYLLGFDTCEHPIALQLGGSEPADLACCAQIAEQRGYDEVNLNVGCPSERVKKGAFGACLMNEPQLVADCVAAMKAAVSVPITVKTRIGVDHNDSYEALQAFVALSAASGCETFIIHARKAWLKGLSPKQNREIPPLNYEVVYRLKCDFPSLEIILNGGVKSTAAVQTHLAEVDGVMIGRQAYSHPAWLNELEQVIYAVPAVSQAEAVRAYFPYVERQLVKGVKLRSITRHMMGLFEGMPGARAWRRHLSVASGRQSVAVIEEALACWEARQ